MNICTALRQLVLTHLQHAATSLAVQGQGGGINSESDLISSRMSARADNQHIFRAIGRHPPFTLTQHTMPSKEVNDRPGEIARSGCQTCMYPEKRKKSATGGSRAGGSSAAGSSGGGSGGGGPRRRRRRRRCMDGQHLTFSLSRCLQKDTKTAFQTCMQVFCVELRFCLRTWRRRRRLHWRRSCMDRRDNHVRPWPRLRKGRSSSSGRTCCRNSCVLPRQRGFDVAGNLRGGGGTFVGGAAHIHGKPCRDQSLWCGDAG